MRALAAIFFIHTHSSTDAPIEKLINALLHVPPLDQMPVLRLWRSVPVAFRAPDPRHSRPPL